MSDPGRGQQLSITLHLVLKDQTGSDKPPQQLLQIEKKTHDKALLELG